MTDRAIWLRGEPEIDQLLRLQHVLDYIHKKTVQVTPLQLSMLVELGKNPGFSYSELARACGCATSTVTIFSDIFSDGPGRKTTKAAGLGWVSVTPCPSDRRLKTLELTEEGERVLAVVVKLLWL